MNPLQPGETGPKRITITLRLPETGKPTGRYIFRRQDVAIFQHPGYDKGNRIQVFKMILL